jgi:hypothetical protein
MLRTVSSRARGAVIAALIVAVSACDNQITSSTTSPNLRPNHDLVSAGAPSDTEFHGSIILDSLASNTLVIGGPAIPYTAEIRKYSSGDFSLQVDIVQGNVRIPLDVVTSLCGPPVPDDFCRRDRQIAAPAASPLMPGAAIVEMRLLRECLGVTTVVSTRDVSVTLASGQTVSAVTKSATSLVIGGPLALFTATLQNAVPSVSGVAIQSWLVQPFNNARRSAGANGAQVQCGSGAGILPTGTCTFSSVLVASNGGAGTGTLSPGLATLEVDLVVNGTVMSQRTTNVSLTSSAAISGLTLSFAPANTVTIEGASVGYTATLQNSGANLAGVSIQGFVSQANGAARRFAGGTSVSCGVGSAVLPQGTCTVPFQLTATNNSSGKGTLVSGDATFELELQDANGAVLSTATIPLNLADGPLQSPPSADRVAGAKILRAPNP